MICDSHCHLKHGNKERTEYTPEAIVRIMDEVGIDRSAVFAMCVSSAEATGFAQRAAEAYPDRLIPYAYAIPHIAESALDVVEDAISRLHFRGIKLHVGETSLAGYVIDPLFELAAKYAVPVLVDLAGRVDDASRIVRSFPHTTVILAHFGRYLCTDHALLHRFVELAEGNGNTILDTSGVVFPWIISEAVKRVGSGRLIFGIDGPHPYPTPEAYARDEIQKIQRLPVSTVDKENILWNTAARVLQL